MFCTKFTVKIPYFGAKKVFFFFVFLRILTIAIFAYLNYIIMQNLKNILGVDSKSKVYEVLGPIWSINAPLNPRVQINGLQKAICNPF